MDIIKTIAQELSVSTTQVSSTVALLDGGATVPFIARYRKEATGGLSDTQLRDLAERLTYLREFVDRQQVILKSIDEQGKLTPDLKQQILTAETKTRLEDLYLPYKPKRRTKAQIAKEAGLEPLADALREQLELDPLKAAEGYLNPEQGVTSAQDALEGAKHIIAESLAENADLLAACRDLLWKHAVIMSKVAKDKEEEGSKFADYFAFEEAVHKIPSHRLLALFRGRKENILHLSIQFPEDSQEQQCLQLIAKSIQSQSLPVTHWLWQTVQWAWKIKLHLKLELELMTQLKIQADEAAIKVFRDNLANLLMAAPAGNHVVLGLDPGYRTGVKVVVIDGTGKLLDHDVIYPHAPQKKWQAALATLAKLCNKHQVHLVSIGNGTASRETDQLVAELCQAMPDLKLTKIVVSEAGASVYSASELAAKEFPSLDVSYRGAVSIARRLQDPLAELVKIDPKSIGVGQYQHDVNQVKLEHSLKDTVEDCVNAVGADLNTASIPLLTSIAGLNETTAKNIVDYREQNGRFNDRKALLNVPRMGNKTFEQAAGFLRIVDGDNPLDSSAVHPESYPIVEQIAAKCNTPIAELIGNETVLQSINASQFVSDTAGLPTIMDILSELNKPGRDPRPEFKTANFTDGVNEIKDLKVGMELEGVITNVANFGAFVDIGVHQDGLVHVSEIADHFVKDLHQEVKVGQIVKVRVLEVDEKRKRISLSMKSGQRKTVKKPSKPESSFTNNSLAEQFKQALDR